MRPPTREFHLEPSPKRQLLASNKRQLPQVPQLRHVPPAFNNPELKKQNHLRESPKALTVQLETAESIPKTSMLEI